MSDNHLRIEFNGGTMDLAVTNPGREVDAVIILNSTDELELTRAQAEYLGHFLIHYFKYANGGE